MTTDYGPSFKACRLYEKTSQRGTHPMNDDIDDDTPPTSVQGEGRVTGRIYIARIGTLIKIGHSTNVHGRIRQHRQWYRKPVELLCSFPGSREDEKAIHEGLATWRVGRRSVNGSPEELFMLPDEHVATLVAAARRLMEGTHRTTRVTITIAIEGTAAETITVETASDEHAQGLRDVILSLVADCEPNADDEVEAAAWLVDQQLKERFAQKKGKSKASPLTPVVRCFALEPGGVE